jgi:hypothetical protein
MQERTTHLSSSHFNSFASVYDRRRVSDLLKNRHPEQAELASALSKDL